MFPSTMRVAEYPSVRAIDIAADRMCGFSISKGRFIYEAIYSPRKDSDALFVCFHGSVDRNKYQLPVFARWDWNDLFRANILSISDPTLRLSPTLTLGWYIGTRCTDLTATITEIVMQVAKICGVPNHSVIFFGSSAGGYASLIMASRFDGARAISIDAQTDLSKYEANLVAEFISVFGGYDTVAAAQTAFPERFSAIEAVRTALAMKHDIKLIVSQNLQDKIHLENHYQPFIRAFDAPERGGVDPSGRIMTMQYDHGRGHGHAPAEVNQELIRRASDFLMQPMPWRE